MTTFDQVLPTLAEIFSTNTEALASVAPIIVNRDLNGRVRLIVDEKFCDDTAARHTLKVLTQAMAEKLGSHAFTPERAVLFESNMVSILKNAASWALEGFKEVSIIDRLATAGNWASIAAESTQKPRIVFFSIKGGVGRSTALAASAWALAEQGKRVLVLDLDLESPGLSSSLLPEDRRPTYGIADWLVEDLVDNGNAVFDEMVATSTLSHNGEIYVVPAHGREPGEYLAKLGRVWMPKISADGVQEPWAERLRRLIDALETRWQPDVILIDSRAGIDEVGSACVTDLGANLILLFAIDGEQTWSGYRILFRHWRTSGVAQDIRERLQVVGAMIPELDSVNYFDGLRERAWVTFTEELYDEVPPGELTDERWSFDESDENAPHHPWSVRWHRGFAALRSLHTRMETIDKTEASAIFGPLIDGLENVIDSRAGTKNE